MAGESKTTKPTVNGLGAITASENELNSLFKEILDGVRDDITEAQTNVEMYLDAMMTESGGKETYGPPYNVALQIKGQARARQLSFLNMFKDRVAKKEQMKMVTDAKGGVGAVQFDNYELNKFIDDYENQEKFQTKPSISDEEEDEMDIDDDA